MFTFEIGYPASICNSKDTIIIPPVFPTTAQKLVIPVIIPAVPPAVMISTGSPQLTHNEFPKSPVQIDSSNDDDDWDDFQSYPVEDDDETMPDDSQMQSDIIDEQTHFENETHFREGNQIERDNALSEDMQPVSTEKTSEVVHAASDKIETIQAEKLIEGGHASDVEHVKISCELVHAAAYQTGSVKAENLTETAHASEVDAETVSDADDDYIIPTDNVKISKTRFSDEMRNNEENGEHFRKSEEIQFDVKQQANNSSGSHILTDAAPDTIQQDFGFSTNDLSIDYTKTDENLLKDSFSFDGDSVEKKASSDI